MTDIGRMIGYMSEMQHDPAVPDWTLGWRLQRALGHAGMKVEDMAHELGVSRGTMSRWLNDHGPVRDIYIKQWALRCGVPFEWLKGAAPDPAHTTNESTTRRYVPDNTNFTLAA